MLCYFLAYRQFFQLDQTFAASNPGYSLNFSSGFNNVPGASSVPEPHTGDHRPGRDLRPILSHRSGRQTLGACATRQSGIGRRRAEPGADPSTGPSPRYFRTLPRVRSRVGGRAETTQGDHQKWTAITLGGPAVPDITLAERTTCMFLLDQSLGAFFTASLKYAGLVRNSAAAEVP